MTRRPLFLGQSFTTNYKSKKRVFEGEEPANNANAGSTSHEMSAPFLSPIVSHSAHVHVVVGYGSISGWLAMSTFSKCRSIARGITQAALLHEQAPFPVQSQKF